MHRDIGFNRIIDMIIVIELNRETSADLHPYYLTLPNYLPHDLSIYHPTMYPNFYLSSSSSSSSSSPLLSLVQVPAKLAINLSIHTQHTYDNGVDRTGDRVFRKYSFLHEEREEEKKNF